MGPPSTMKTTVELPGTLFRQATAVATLRGRKLKDLIEDGLRRVLDEPPDMRSRRDLAGLMRPSRGVV